MKSQPKIVKCNQCEDNGIIVFKKKIQKIIYDYAAYCDKCKAGERYKYCGRTLAANKSEYYTLPMSAYFETTEEDKKYYSKRDEPEEN